MKRETYFMAAKINLRDLLRGFLTFVCPALLVVILLPFSSGLEISFGLAYGAFSTTASILILAAIAVSIVNFLYYYKRKSGVAWGSFFGAIVLCLTIYLIWIF